MTTYVEAFDSNQGTHPPYISAATLKSGPFSTDFLLHSNKKHTKLPRKLESASKTPSSLLRPAGPSAIRISSSSHCFPFRLSPVASLRAPSCLHIHCWASSPSADLQLKESRSASLRLYLFLFCSFSPSPLSEYLNGCSTSCVTPSVGKSQREHH